MQEAKGKWPELKAQFPDLKLHLVGPLQSNKAKEAVELFDAIHSIDRPKIARAIAEEMKKQGSSLELFMQVNTGEEPQKAGVIPAELPALRRAVPRRARARDRRADVHSARRRGAGVAFRLPRKARGGERLRATLSMGMSDDYETAVQFGATHVRVGSAIFGSRSNP